MQASINLSETSDDTVLIFLILLYDYFSNQFYQTVKFHIYGHPALEQLHKSPLHFSPLHFSTTASSERVKGSRIGQILPLTGCIPEELSAQLLRAE